MYPFPAGDGSPTWCLFDLSRAHRRAFFTLAKRAGLLDYGKPIVLFFLLDLRKRDIRPTQREISEMMHLSPSTVTVSLQSLERHGCIRKIPDEKDQRKNRIVITEEGVAVAGRFKEVFKTLADTMAQGFSPEELEASAAYFNRMTQNLLELVPQEERNESEC